ncbi:MAG: hypothetical protein AVDCRST_MAG71-257, partial [uncultured Lysobacter sp.]
WVFNTHRCPFNRHRSMVNRHRRPPNRHRRMGRGASPAVTRACVDV